MGVATLKTLVLLNHFNHYSASINLEEKIALTNAIIRRILLIMGFSNRLT